MGWGILAMELIHACSLDFSYTPYSCIPIFLNVYLFIYVHMYLLPILIYGPRREKTCLWGFRQSGAQTSLLNYSDSLEN